MSTLEIHYIMHNLDKVDCRELRTSGAQTSAPGQPLVVMKVELASQEGFLRDYPLPKCDSLEDLSPGTTM